MRIKKILLSILSVLLMFLLVSCDETVKISYVDKNGNNVEFTLTEKADKKTMQNIFNYVESVDYIKTSFVAEGSANIVNQYTKDNKFVLDGKGTIYKNNEYLKGHGTMKVSHYNLDTKSSEYMNYGDIFGDFSEKSFYGHIKLDNKDFYKKFTVNSLELPKIETLNKYILTAKISNISLKSFKVTLTLDSNLLFEGIKSPLLELNPCDIVFVIDTKTGRILSITYDNTFEYPSFEEQTFNVGIHIKSNINIKYDVNPTITPLTKEEKALYI